MMLKMNQYQEASGGGVAGGIDKVKYVNVESEDVQSKLPQLWDVLTLRKEAGSIISPTQVVLFQELERFNKLIIKIYDSHFNLKRALKGEIGMSSDLDELSLSLFNGFLPVFEPDQRTQEYISHWILQSVAMTLNVDY